MAKKPEYRKFQTKYIIRAIVCKEVIAISPEKAKENADETMAGKIFIDCLESIDERIEYAGFDDITAWDTIEG